MARRKKAEQTPPVTSSKRMGRHAGGSVVLSVSVALFLIGVFALFVLHADRLTQLIRENMEVQVFLHRHLNDSARTALRQRLASLPYTGQKSGQAAIRYISREEALLQMEKETGPEFKDVLESNENPLRDCFVINIKSQYHGSERLKQIKAEIETLPGVYEVEYIESLVEQINNNVRRAIVLILSFAVILIITVIVLINSAIRLALFSQRFLIRSMQLVGATDFFIARPFLWRAALHGFLGGLIACVMLVLLLFYVNSRLPELTILQSWLSIGLLFLTLLASGVFTCVLSAYRAVNKYLYLSVEQLY